MKEDQKETFKNPGCKEFRIEHHGNWLRFHVKVGKIYSKETTKQACIVMVL